ncbi:MAG: hypothetical protein ETSY1_38870 [Candidatus Entotheonella factor]|uniref:Polysaccharide export protein N-terminal domain-containing protein n=1 Tax=Entotheonella factor TaxID=1429438 RepID=W4L755_ENTF1|nr:MAG: hypothetical protein ETSY1_38870 [Candidatus Entotheonella factor]
MTLNRGLPVPCALGSGGLARREEADMATFHSRLHQRQCGLRALWFSFTMCIGLAIVLVGCAPQLPYAPPVPPQHLQQLANQFELTNRLQELTLNSYTLDAGDKLLVRVDGSRPASREVTVDPQGTITYPRVGRINVAGLTLPELDRSLGMSLAGNSRKARKVTTTITKYRKPACVYPRGSASSWDASLATLAFVIGTHYSSGRPHA